MTTALIALGSNISPETNLPMAVRAISRLGRVSAVSSIWESDPVGFLDQPRFCNAAVSLETAESWHELRQGLREIEDRLGRVRDPCNKNAPRTIDLDIAIFGDLVWSGEGVEIPDPEIPRRPFLAIPLAEVAPEHFHPTLHLSLREIAERASTADGLTRRSDLDLRAACDQGPS